MTPNKLLEFENLTVEERLNRIVKTANLSEEDKHILSGHTPFTMKIANSMIENAVGMISTPIGIATNFIVNGREKLIPMATEEPSVISVTSNIAKIASLTGGFITSQNESYMIGQLHIVNIPDPYAAMSRLYENKRQILEICNSRDATLISLGGGAKDIEIRVLQTPKETMLVMHIFVDTKDAMGANAVNTMTEAVRPFVEEITLGSVVLSILTNLADRKIVRVRTVIPSSELGGEKVVKKMITAYELAEYDPYRAATHNKGIMNGISAVVTASGNDTRAVEAGAHAYASMSGRYRPLTRLESNPSGDLVGTIEIPMPIGIMGGSIKTNPTSGIVLKILDVASAEELAGIIASVGLAVNLGWLHALATDGIQKGHMALHARNLAIMAGANDNNIDTIVKIAIQENDIRYDRILELTKEFSN